MLLSGKNKQTTILLFYNFYLKCLRKKRMQELKQKQLTSIMNFKLNMKLLVFVAIFVFYVISKTDGLRCYHCYDGHNTCDIQTETAYHIPTDAAFCYTRFFFPVIIVIENVIKNFACTEIVLC